MNKKERLSTFYVLFDGIKSALKITTDWKPTELVEEVCIDIYARTLEEEEEETDLTYFLQECLGVGIVGAGMPRGDVKNFSIAFAAAVRYFTDESTEILFVPGKISKKYPRFWFTYRENKKHWEVYKIDSKDKKRFISYISLLEEDEDEWLEDAVKEALT